MEIIFKDEVVVDIKGYPKGYPYGKKEDAIKILNKVHT